jgi:hypothetical protein
MLDATVDRYQSLQREDAALLPIARVGTMLLGISDIERLNLVGFVMTDSAGASPYAGLVAPQVHFGTPDPMEWARGAGEVNSDGNPDWRDWSAEGSRMDGVGAGSSPLSVSSSGHGRSGR